jgi:hypothetical protein
MTSRRVTQSEVEEIKRLAAAGHGPVTIGRMINRPYDTVRMHAARHGIVMPVRGAQGARKPAAGAPNEAAR